MDNLSLVSKKKYLQRYITYKVLNHEYLPFQKIGSEASFAIKFDMSRSAVRNALKELKYAGFLFTKKGTGYFITKEFVELLHEGEIGEVGREIIFFDEPKGQLKEIIELFKEVFFHEEDIMNQIKIKYPFGYKKITFDEDGLQTAKVSIINTQLARKVNFEELKKTRFLSLVTFNGLKMSWIKRIVVFSKTKLFEEEAKKLGYKEEYPIVLTASFADDELVDVSANIYRKKDFKFSINQEIFL